MLQRTHGRCVMRSLRSRVVLVVALVLAAGVGFALDAVAQTIEPGAGTWRPWVLTSGKDLRLPPPQDAQATAREARELKELAAQRDGRTLERIRYWDHASPSYRWNEILTDTAVAHALPTAAGFRSFAMLNV